MNTQSPTFRVSLDVLTNRRPMLTVEVVVVAYDATTLTDRCLRHVAAQTRDHRLIGCDNGSTDGPERGWRPGF